MKKCYNVEITKKRFKDILIIIFLLLLPFIFFYKITFLKQVFFGGDITFQNYPQRVWVVEQIKKGIFPLWTPNIFSGFPLFAEGQTGMLFPLNILFLFLPSLLAYWYIFIFQFSLAGFFMYLYARILGLNKFSSLLAGIFFMFSPILLSPEYINHIGCYIWLPLIFYFVELGKKKFIFNIFASLILGIQFFSSYPMASFQILLAFFLYFIFTLLLSFKNKEVIITIRNFAFIFIFGLCLASIQLIPTYELTKFSARGAGLTWEEMTENSLHPLYLISQFLPSQGVSWGLVGRWSFLFSISVILAGFGIFSYRYKKIIWFFCILSVISLFLAFGKYNPAYKILSFVPPFNFFRYPDKYTFLYNFSICILAGYGFKFLQTKINILRDIKYKIMTLILVICMLILNFNTINIRFEEPNFVPLSVYHANELFDIEGDGMCEICITKPEIYYKIPEFVKFLKKDKDIFRIYSMGGRDSLGPLEPNLPILFDLVSSQGYSPLVSERDIKLRGGRGNLIYLSNIKYVITREKIFDPRLKLVYDKEVKIYEFKDFPKRAFVVHKAIIFENEDELLENIGYGDFDPRYTVALEEKFDGYLSKSKERSYDEEVKIVKNLPGEIVIKVNLKYPGFIVLTDSFYPGWKVKINNSDGKIFKANYQCRAIYLKEGESIVSFYYDPFSFKLGKFISISSLFLLIFSIFFLKK